MERKTCFCLTVSQSILTTKLMIMTKETWTSILSNVTEIR